MPSRHRERIQRCMGKCVNHIELAIAAGAEVWANFKEREELIEKQKEAKRLDPNAPDPAIEDNYAAQLAIVLEAMEQVNQGMQAIAMYAMDMDHDDLMRMSQLNPRRVSFDKSQLTGGE
jgi:hypothetical protein